MASYLVIAAMRVVGLLPLRVVRALGWLLGMLLYGLVKSRRRVVLTNLRLCFPQWSEAHIQRVAKEHFVYFGKAWLDRAWLWHGTPAMTLKRLRITGAVHEIQGDEPTVLFCPHFVGLDACWIAFTQQMTRQWTTLYTNQANPVMDAWILKSRQRYGNGRLFGRIDGVKTIVASMRAGEPFIILPDMNYGVHESVFVPFYGVSACTVPSLPRFARLGQAKVVPLVNRMTPQGYDVEIHPHWENYPTKDPVADTALMNKRLEALIDTMPAQYYWVHKRFKSRPPGEPEVY